MYETPNQDNFEQASNIIHHINRAKLLTENSVIARPWDILSGWGTTDPLQSIHTYAVIFHRIEF